MFLEHVRLEDFDPVAVRVLDKGQSFHFAVVRLFHELYTKLTNALLISGPSKTADIEQTLAYGVHGPKELIVLIIE